ncbi:MAG: hypothetical protein F6K54_09815 [Okeania sp. SIO3B5]|nr:hypothetical protein [Okeania sp. SIO3B5]
MRIAEQPLIAHNISQKLRGCNQYSFGARFYELIAMTTNIGDFSLYELWMEGFGRGKTNIFRRFSP